MVKDDKKDLLLSLIVITKNNDKDLDKCLSSVTGLVDEIVVVDTGSTDKTKEIADKYTYKVFDYKWNDNFSEAKNYALKWAAGKWVINLDADESLSKSDHKIILDMINNASLDIGGFSLIQRNYTNDIGKFGLVSTKDDSYSESSVASGFVPRRIVRIFRNEEKIFFEGTVHDSVEKSILRSRIVEETSIPIHHYGPLTRNNDERTRMYVDMERNNLRAKDFFQRYQIASQLHSLGKSDEALDWLDQCLVMNKNFLLAWLEKGTIFLEKENFDEAKKCLLEASSLGQHEMVYGHLGIVYARMGDYDAAIDYLRKAIRINPKNADFCFNLGLALNSSNRKAEAGLAFKRAVDLNPEYGKRVKFE
ncbi:MAG: glycosyltransferase [Nanoarchaeota archaeon]